MVLMGTMEVSPSRYCRAVLIDSFPICVFATADTSTRRGVQDAIHQGEGAVWEYDYTGTVNLERRERVVD